MGFNFASRPARRDTATRFGFEPRGGHLSTLYRRAHNPDPMGGPPAAPFDDRDRKSPYVRDSPPPHSPNHETI
jgi:hypothetical protein